MRGIWSPKSIACLALILSLSGITAADICPWIGAQVIAQYEFEISIDPPIMDGIDKIIWEPGNYDASRVQIRSATL